VRDERAGDERLGQPVVAEHAVDRRGGHGVGAVPGGEPLRVGRRRVCRGRGQGPRGTRGEHHLERGARILPRCVRIEAELRDVLAQAVEPRAQRL
jgi:hypothetical protein